MSVGIISCNNKRSNDKNAKIDIIFDKLSIDSVTIDSIPNCSFTGFSGIYEDSLYFYDEQLSYFYAISLDGSIGKRRLGLGHSSREIPISRPQDVSFSKQSGELVALGGSYDMYIYDVKADKVRKVLLKHEGDMKSYSSASAYTSWNYMVMRNDDSNLYYNVIGNNEDVDIFHKDDYFKKAAIIMKVSLKDGEMEPIGRYSDFYVNNRNKIWHLPYYYFDIDNDGGFYVTYQADTLIYHYDANFNLIETYGFKGKDMNTQYTIPGKTEESFAKAYESDIKNTGYYYWLENQDEYTFRSYRKSGTAKTDGLQIYKDTTLVGDVDVPHNFKVAGKVGEYYVTKITIDEKAGKMYFYKFRLDEKQ